MRAPQNTSNGGVGETTVWPKEGGGERERGNVNTDGRPRTLINDATPRETGVGADDNALNAHTTPCQKHFFVFYMHRSV